VKVFFLNCGYSDFITCVCQREAVNLIKVSSSAVLFLSSTVSYQRIA